jgi:hypothetical protein
MLIRSASHDVIVRVFLLISRLEIMRTRKHESKNMLTHTNTNMTRILYIRTKTRFVLLLCYINKFYSRNIKHITFIYLFIYLLKIAIRKTYTVRIPIGYWADVLVRRPERVHRPYVVESVECPSPFQPSGRWWCNERPHEGAEVFSEGGVVGSRSSLEDFTYLGHVQVTM